MVFSSPLSLPLLLLLLASTLTITTAESSSTASLNGNATIYDILSLYGLPPGIFPNTVTSFSLSGNGALSINLSGPCYVDFDWNLYYAPTVTGFLSYGFLSGLSGIQTSNYIFWFFWYDVHRIRVDQPPTKYIHFDLSWSKFTFNIDNFLTVHSCNKSSCHLCLWASIHRAIQWTKDLFTNLSW